MTSNQLVGYLSPDRTPGICYSSVAEPLHVEERALSYIRLIASAYDPIVPIGA